MKIPKILFSGATGWVGRELLHILSQSGINLDSLVLISSKNQVININGNQLNVSSFNNQSVLSPVQSYFDFAFLTKNQLEKYGPKEFKEINLKIISNSTSLIKRVCPQTVILASSGAIYGTKNFNLNDALYADLKKNQEEEIRKACEISRSNLIVSRIFNLSGLGVTKESNYAIVDLTLKAMRNLDLTTSSNRKVTRRYCDLTQLLKLLVEMGKLNLNCTFDSGGVKMDLRTLSYKITEVIETKSKVLFPDLYENLEADNYFSDSDNYEKLLLELLGIESMSIENQIHNTRTALLSKL